MSEPNDAILTFLVCKQTKKFLLAKLKLSENHQNVIERSTADENSVPDVHQLVPSATAERQPEGRRLFRK